MPRRKTRTLTEVELQIMQVVWNRGEATVEQIRDDLASDGRPSALPTIRTMLGILQEKGQIERRAEGRAFVYSARVSRDAARRSIVRDVVDRAFDGSAMNLVASLLGGRMLSKRELDQVRALIEEQGQGGKK